MGSAMIPALAARLRRRRSRICRNNRSRISSCSRTDSSTSRPSPSSQSHSYESSQASSVLRLRHEEQSPPQDFYQLKEEDKRASGKWRVKTRDRRPGGKLRVRLVGCPCSVVVKVRCDSCLRAERPRCSCANRFIVFTIPEAGHSRRFVPTRNCPVHGDLRGDQPSRAVVRGAQPSSSRALVVKPSPPVWWEAAFSQKVAELLYVTQRVPQAIDHRFYADELVRLNFPHIKVQQWLAASIWISSRPVSVVEHFRSLKRKTSVVSHIQFPQGRTKRRRESSIVAAGEVRPKQARRLDKVWVDDSGLSIV